MRHALYLIHIIGGPQFARAEFRKIGEGMQALDLGRPQVVIEKPPVGGPGKGGVRLIEDAGLDPHAVSDARDLIRRGAVRQGLARLVKIGRRGQPGGRERRQLIGAL